MSRHELLLEPSSETTLGRCTCGAWSKEADLAVVTLTGRSREDALRAAHGEHTSALRQATS